MIREISDALVDLVHAATPDLGPWVELHSLSAADAGAPTNRAVLALVSIQPHPHLVNRPLVEGVAGLVRAPLYLKLTYLVTYLGDHDEAQIRLGRIAQAFHTTPILTGSDLQPPLTDEVDAVTIRMLSPTHDERNQLWGALGRPGRLALFYEVDVAPVEILQRDGVGRVAEHRVEYVGAP